MHNRLIVAVLALAVSALSVAARQPPPSPGVVSFKNSGAPAAQAPFLRGLALLHSFEYEHAAAEFRNAAAADPGFAMAYWGEAMTHNHAVWMEQDLGAARAALARLGPTPQARAGKAGTERERAYLAAIETLYGEGTKDDRDLRYEAAMAALHTKYSDDVDAAAFHALAILGTAHAGRDVATYMRAAAILEEIFPANRQHPGVLHYLIHCYDDPVHAPLGLRAARLYGAVAPDAGHALHMTTHIFLAMGMWDDVTRVNRQAIAVVNAQRKAAGRGEVFCGHYPSWLVYGDLQQRNFDEVRRYKFRGSSGKVNLALDGLPNFISLPGEGRHLRGAISISPSVEYMERAYDAAKYGRYSQRPYIDVVIPSLTDPSVAPPGKHVMSCFVQYAPYHLKDANWDAERERFGDVVIDTLSEYAPNLKSLILHRQVITPLDLEREWGLSEGNIFQGELALEQLLFLRPIPGWARYRTPVDNLYMCGSATHPGGGIMGAPGRNAALEILK
jgi:hypothetical protein